MADSTEATGPLIDPEMISKVLRNLEQQLGAPEGSLTNLFQEADWSMIIKAHALIEGAVSYMLALTLDPRLKDIFSMLELGREQTGKLEFIKVLDLLTPGERSFIKVLSKLRNVLAHDARYLGFNLKQHLADQDKNQRRAFYESLTFDIADSKKDSWLLFVREQPAVGVVSSAARIVIKCVTKGQVAMLDKKHQAFKINYAELMMHEFEGPDVDIPSLIDGNNTQKKPLN